MRREPENFSIRHVVSQAKPGVGEVLVNEGVHNRFLCRLLCQAMTQPAWLTARFQYLAPPALWSGRSGQYGPRDRAGPVWSGGQWSAPPHSPWSGGVGSYEGGLGGEEEGKAST